MTLTALDVYMVLRLDGLKDGLTIFSVIGLGATGVFFIATGQLTSPRWWRPIALACLITLVGCVNALLPSSREAATILLLPPIVNSKFVQQDLPAESAELYGLLKDCLRELARPVEQPPRPRKED